MKNISKNITPEVYKETAKLLVVSFYNSFESTFSNESFLNAVEMKQFLGSCIKNHVIDGYRNFEYRDYKVVFNALLDGETYHIGVDFGKQVVHAVIEESNVYSIYFNNSLDC